MQPVPEGYKPLGFAGFADKGVYSESEVYAENDIVHKDNTAWRCLINGTAGITPAEGENWTVFIASTTDSSGITTTDTQGIVGSVGESVSNQSIVDELAERAVSDRAMLSDAFSTSKAYTSGDYAIYNNTLYRFTSAKPAGAWDASKAVAVSVAGELDALNEKIITGVEDLNNPPAATIFTTGINPIGNPSGLGGNSCTVLQNYPAETNYTAQLAFSFGSDKIAIRRKYRTEENPTPNWTNWQYFVSENDIKPRSIPNVISGSAPGFRYVSYAGWMTKHIFFLSYASQLYDYDAATKYVSGGLNYLPIMAFNGNIFNTNRTLENIVFVGIANLMRKIVVNGNTIDDTLSVNVGIAYENNISYILLGQSDGAWNPQGITSRNVSAGSILIHIG